MVGAMLRLDASRIIKTALAGTATERFTDVIEATFGTEEPKELQEELEEAEEHELGMEQEEEPGEGATAGPSTSGSRGPKRKGAPLSSKSQRPKTTYSPKGGVCSLKDAAPLFPSVSDADNYLHCGINPSFISSRRSSAVTKEAGYSCLYSEASKAGGKVVTDCEYLSTTKAQLSTHIRQFHLGVAVTCFICNRRWWSAATWFEHMRKAHANLKRADYFLREGAEAELQDVSLQVKTEVNPSDI